MAFIAQRDIAGQDWVKDKKVVLEKAKEQGGRCDLQVILPIRKLVEAAGGNKEQVVESSAVTSVASNSKS